MRHLHPTSTSAGQETTRPKLYGQEQMASLAELMAEICSMPGNWFQQDFLGRYVGTEIAKALSSPRLLQQDSALSESKLALYQKVLGLSVTYFHHLSLVFKGLFFSLSPFTSLLCSWSLACFILEDKSSWKSEAVLLSHSPPSQTENTKEEAPRLSSSIADYSLDHNFNRKRGLIVYTQISVRVHPSACSWSSSCLSNNPWWLKIDFSRNRKEHFANMFNGVLLIVLAHMGSKVCQKREESAWMPPTCMHTHLHMHIHAHTWTKNLSCCIAVFLTVYESIVDLLQCPPDSFQSHVWEREGNRPAILLLTQGNRGPQDKCLCWSRKQW